MKSCFGGMSLVGLMVIAALPGCGGSGKPAAQTAATDRSSKVQPAIVDPGNTAATAIPEKAKQPSFRVIPSTAKIEPGDDGLQFVVAPASEGTPSEINLSSVSWSAQPADVLQFDSAGYAQPLKAGKAVVTATMGAETVSATVEVGDGLGPDRPWDFAADITPVLTRQGCNTGGCHGKADGQNGFHLSLFGYDPEGDFQAITRGSGGRRVLPLDPEESLLLRKATGQTPHRGGQRIAPGSDVYDLVRGWIAAGAPEHRGKNHGAMTKIVVEPTEIRLDEPGDIQLRVVAQYEDGHSRDITRMAQYKVNDDSAATISDSGAVKLLRRAEADLIVRYGSEVITTRIATIINPDLKFDFAALPRRNVIDEELFKRLESLKVPPSPRSSDAAFLRRVTLDITGQQPSTARIREFLKDTDPDKRARKVDALLASDDFVNFWQIKYGDMLQISPAKFNAGAGPYQAWLKRALIDNTPWDEMVRQLLTSLGDPTDRLDGGPVNYAMESVDPKVAAEQTAQRFLGLRLRCAQCHDHPFDVWTQDDYFGLAAIFARVGPEIGPGQMANRPKVAINPKGSIEHLRTKQPAAMRLLDGTPVEVAENDDPRKNLASWMTDPKNPFFARAAANWVWAQFFGRGIAEPADDLSRANPPVHPELLDALAKHFVDHKYDVRDLIRTVATSEAYSLSSVTLPGNEHDTRLFSHHLPRPLTAHQMTDAISQSTGVPLRFGPLNTIRKAIEVNDPTVPNSLLDAFGRCPRTAGCAAVATPSLSLRQSLMLIGGNTIDDKVWALNGYLSNLMIDKPEAEDLVELLYLRSLCRPPSEEELSYWSAELKGASSYSEAAEDLFWALLNSREFAFNH